MQYTESTSVKQKKKRSLVKMQTVWAICFFVMFAITKYCFPDFFNQISVSISKLFERPMIFDPYKTVQTVIRFVTDLTRK